MDPKEKDLELWRRWRQSRSNADLEALIGQMMPLIRSEVSKGSGVVAPFVLEAEAKSLALKAFNTYDPNHVPPVALGTHVANALQKLKRTVYERQSTVSVPEHQRITYNNYLHARAHLADVLGHPPTIDHVADHLGLPVPKLQSIVGNVEKRELLESGEGPTFLQHADDDVIHLAYHDMTPQQKRIFELRTGYNGTHAPDRSKIKDAKGIMADLGITQGQLSYEITKITALLHKAQGLR